jgi:hypothetical protein
VRRPHALQLPATGAPDLFGRVVAFRNWRIIDGRLSSPYLPVVWTDRVMRAECYGGARRLAPGRIDVAPAFVDTDGPHVAPDPDCRCGIYAYYRPSARFSTIDYRGVSGIVTVWGALQVHHGGLRAQHARVEALATYGRWSTRQRSAVDGVAGELGVDLVDLDELERAATRYGTPLPPSLLPEPEPPPRRGHSVRWAFARLRR